MAARHRSTVNALLLAFRNADGVRGRRIELDHFLAQHGVDVCLLNETHLDPGQAFRFANNVCHRTDRSSSGGGTAILVSRGIEHHALPVLDLRHLEATAIELKLAGKPTKVLAIYLSPSRPLIKSDFTACLSGGLPVLMAGDLNAKHVDWNSRLTTVRGKLLRDYADRHSTLNIGPDSPTTVPYNPSATPDFLDVAVPKSLPTPVHLTACSALSSDHLHILIDTRCRLSFFNLPNGPDFNRTDWSKFQACLDNNIPFISETTDEADIHTSVENLTSAIRGALEVSTQRVELVLTRGFQYLLIFRMKYA
jgi:hypothetical protein